MTIKKTKEKKKSLWFSICIAQHKSLKQVPHCFKNV